LKSNPGSQSTVPARSRAFNPLLPTAWASRNAATRDPRTAPVSESARLDSAKLVAVTLGFVEYVSSSDSSKPKTFVAGWSGTSWAQLRGNAGDAYGPRAMFRAKLASGKG
jgi:hypothetical protein